MAEKQSTFSKVVAAMFTSVVAPVMVANMVANSKTADSAPRYQTESRKVSVELPAALGQPEPIATQPTTSLRYLPQLERAYARSR